MFEAGLALLRVRGLGDANILSGLGHVYALSGRVSEALLLLEEANRGETSISAMASGQAVRMSRLAEAYLLAGRAEEGLERALAAVDLARTHHERANEAVALRILGDMLLRRNPLEPTSAEQHYTDSLTLAERLGMRPLIAHCSLRLATLRRLTGQPQGAAESFARATRMYEEMQMPYWLQQAELERVARS